MSDRSWESVLDLGRFCANCFRRMQRDSGHRVVCHGCWPENNAEIWRQKGIQGYAAAQKTHRGRRGGRRR